MHLGIRIKYLIENKSTLNKLEFANKIGHTSQSLHGIFKKEDVSTSLLKTIANELGISIKDFFHDEKSKLSVVSEESEVYGVINYKEKYFETLEKLNACNERVLAFTDLKKSTTKRP